jgi:hypothetical protein
MRVTLYRRSHLVTVQDSTPLRDHRGEYGTPIRDGSAEELGYETARPERAAFHDSPAATSFLYLITASG